MSQSGEKIVEEVGFWRRLIAWWEMQYGTRAPERMYEALAYAEHRARGYGDSSGAGSGTSLH